MTERFATETIFEPQGLSRRFGRKQALSNVTLTGTKGRILGLVGANGAGKTTLIKLLLGLLRPSAGTVRVFGKDPIAKPEEVLARIGYLSEEREMPGWMRIHELIRYVKAFYPQWDDAYAAELLDTFGLDLRDKVRTLSRGQRAKAGLLIALAYRPELLLLDEPSSGLDVVVRRDILSAIIRSVADEGRTVLFSSHLLDEVERIADDVAIIQQGRLVASGPLDEIKEAHRRITFRLPTPQDHCPELPGLLMSEGDRDTWSALCNGGHEACRAALAQLDAQILDESVPPLEDIIIARTGKTLEGDES